jgi:PAS domain S-box-containing protein
VPVVPEVLRAKVRVFAELHRKSRQLEQLNRELEARVAERTRELEASMKRVSETEERRTLALAAGQMGSWDLDLDRSDCRWDEGQYRIFGVEPETFALEIDNVAALVPAEDWRQLRDAFAVLVHKPGGRQVEFRLRRPNGEHRWCIGAAASSADGTGRVVRLSGVTIDITERKEAEVRQALLAREVDHRAKNALALVQSIVKLSKGDTVEAYVAAVDGRIKALSLAHTLLAQSRWQGADLAGLIVEELAPYRSGEGDRIALAGPAVSLGPRTAQSVALALHELTTNAAKYGALSMSTGRVEVGWDLSGGFISLRWTETGGPSPPSRITKGFGLRVVAASVEQQLGGAATFDWRESGLDCGLRFPISERGGHGNGMAQSGGLGLERADPAAGSVAPIIADGPIAGGRVLLVEDEPLVGMMMSDILREMGCAVLGPVGSTAEARAAVAAGGIDLAVLDINLGHEFVYPLAELLVDRNVPFIFLTGYSTEAVDQRFAHISVLEKPVDRERLRAALTGQALLHHQSVQHPQANHA